MALSVNISGDTSIDQGSQTTLTAVVIDADGNTITSGLTYAWTTSQGSFVGATTGASVVYHADFTETADTDVTITCNVTRAGDASPTVSESSLTAMVDLGISGILVNIHATDTGAVSANTNSILFQENSVGTIETGSDLDLASDLRIYRVRWDNRSGNARLILNRTGGGSLGDYFSGNTAQSIYLVFEDGTYVEIDSGQYGSGSGGFARWDLTDQATIDRLNAWDGTENLLLGVGDAGSVGIAADSGSDTETVTASAVVPLSIEQIDEQFITLGRKNYRLVIDVYGDPDTVRPLGLTEGFDHNWDSMLQKLTILAAEVTRLIGGAIWQIELVKGQAQVVPEILYNVVKPASIFEILPTVHLYRGVPINFDILIQNIPSLINPQSLLISLKSELMEYGLNFKGFIPLGASYSVDADKLQIIVPSETQGGTDTVHEYPFEIESGSPPAIVSPKFTPHGNFGELDFTEPRHALGYEWTLDTGDDPEWHFFNDARNVINPREVEVTPGNLNVTIKFPNIAAASAYEYQLESEDTETEWIRFTGTLANNMITTIIPRLEEGVETKLRIRVGSPWIGPPIEITVFGGRLAYSVHDDGANSYLYIFHTGVAAGGSATRIKRILLPTGIDNPEGLAISGDLAYVADGTDDQIYVFNHANTDDGQRATRTARYDLLTTDRVFRMAIEGDDLYLNNNYNGNNINVYDRNSTDGQNITHLRALDLDFDSSQTATGVRAADVHGMSVEGDRIYFAEHSNSNNLRQVAAYDKDATGSNVPQDFYFDFRTSGNLPITTGLTGFSVVGDTFYSVDEDRHEMYIFKRDPDNVLRSLLIKEFALPSGLTSPLGLDIQK